MSTKTHLAGVRPKQFLDCIKTSQAHLLPTLIFSRTQNSCYSSTGL